MSIGLGQAHVPADSAADQFRTAMQQRGLVPPKELIADGQIHRCDVEGKSGKKDGAYSCNIDTTIKEAAEQMREHNVCRLLVMHEGHVTGIVNLTELLRNNYKLESCDKVLHELLGLRTKRRAKVLKSA